MFSFLFHAPAKLKPRCCIDIFEQTRKTMNKAPSPSSLLPPYPTPSRPTKSRTRLFWSVGMSGGVLVGMARGRGGQIARAFSYKRKFILVFSLLLFMCSFLFFFFCFFFFFAFFLILVCLHSFPAFLWIYSQMIIQSPHPRFPHLPIYTISLSYFLRDYIIFLLPS